MHAAARSAAFISAEEYLESERAAETRSEYVNGEIVSMPGGTFDHDAITGNIFGLIRNQLVGRPCRVFTANMKVRIERANVFRYPDVSALCGPIATYDRVTDAYLNPSFLCEVLSFSTEDYDRGEKFALYRLIDSFVEYLLVARDRRWAQLYRRSRAGGWDSWEFTESDDIVTLESIGCSLRLAEIHDKVEFPAAPRA